MELSQDLERLLRDLAKESFSKSVYLRVGYQLYVLLSVRHHEMMEHTHVWERSVEIYFEVIKSVQSLEGHMEENLRVEKKHYVLL